MFAVVEIAKKQYIVQKGDILDVQKLPDSSKKISFDKVLLLASQNEVKIGAPYVKSAKVEAEIEGAKKGKKVIVYKYKRRKKYRKKQGHRQKYTRIKIVNISPDLTEGSKKEEAEKDVSKKPAPKKSAVKKPAPKKSAAKKIKPKKVTSKKTATKKAKPKKPTSKKPS